jgi:small-conductance mechanosensitive channel
LFLVKKKLHKYISSQKILIINKTIVYLVILILVVTILKELGFQLTTLMGAAGIAGIAIGFAAQTSFSNLISGIFLLWEKPFELGDIIEIDTKTGSVFSMTLLSISLKTFDNKLIRIPNETLIKTPFTNISKFPIRRLDLDINVAYKENIDQIMKILAEVGEKNLFCLDTPKALIHFKGFGSSALEFKCGYWFLKANFIDAKNSIMKDIKERFDQENIEIPFPHLSIYTGSVTKPFPVEIKSNKS